MIDQISDFASECSQWQERFQMEKLEYKRAQMMAEQETKIRIASEQREFDAIQAEKNRAGPGSMLHDL